jgi:3-isopropylmalate dehydratase
MQNGMVPIVLSKEECVRLADDARAGHELEVDLEKQEIRSSSGSPSIPFVVDAFRRQCLLNGLDDIGLTLQKASLIDAFEARRSTTWPWLDGLGYKGKGTNAIPVSRTSKSSDTKLDW